MHEPFFSILKPAIRNLRSQNKQELQLCVQVSCSMHSDKETTRPEVYVIKGLVLAYLRIYVHTYNRNLKSVWFLGSCHGCLSLYLDLVLLSVFQQYVPGILLSLQQWTFIFDEGNPMFLYIPRVLVDSDHFIMLFPGLSMNPWDKQLPPDFPSEAIHSYRHAVLKQL